MQSSLYEGTVRHHRYGAIAHRFQYRLRFAYLDLNELSDLVTSGIVSTERLGINALRVEDHFDEAADILTGVRQLVLEQTGMNLTGPVRMLTRLSSLGHYFSPLNLYYCFAEDDSDEIVAVVAEVSNTPWRDRHHYVLWSGNRTSAARLRFEVDKQMHVSPFLDMNMRYQFQVTPPGEQMAVRIENWRDHEQLFSATMALHEKPLTRRALNWFGLGHAKTSLQILILIYLQAGKLWCKKCRVYPHPKTDSARWQTPSS